MYEKDAKDAAAAAADVVKAAPFLPCFPDTGSKIICCPLQKTAPRFSGSRPQKQTFSSAKRWTMRRKRFARIGSDGDMNCSALTAKKNKKVVQQLSLRENFFVRETAELSKNTFESSV